MSIISRLKTFFGVIPFIVTACIVVNTLGATPDIVTLLLYGAYFIGVLYLSFDKPKINKLCALFLLYLPFTILIGQPDAIFQSWIRLALFALMFIIASPLCQTERARDFREKSLNTVLVFATIVSFLSFFCYFLGINLFVDRYADEFYDDYLASAGHFSGLCNHSMVLGPLSGFAVVFLFYHSLTKNKKILWPVIAACACCTLFAASRAALLAAFAGCFAIIYFLSKNKQSVFRKLIPLGIVFLITLPLWQFAAEGVIHKQESRVAEGGMFDSRTVKIEARLAEFQSKPLTGIGFSAIDPEGQDSFNRITGSIEPGSSWFAILSMTGIIGFVLFILLIKKPISALKNDTSGILYLGLLIFFMVHMLAEGYVFAGGNATCYILWLVIGRSYDYSQRSEMEKV